MFQRSFVAVFANRKIIRPQISDRDVQRENVDRSNIPPWRFPILASCVLWKNPAGLFIDSSLHDVAHAMPEDWHYVEVDTRDLNAASASARIGVNVYPFTYDRKTLPPRG